MIDKPASLGDIAKALKINKRNLHYLVVLGIIKPKIRIGLMNLYELDETVEKVLHAKKVCKENNISLKDLAKNKQ